MTNKNKSVFVIILNWNQPRLTAECVKSVQKSVTKGLLLNIVIVDNGSTDDSVRQFDSLKINNKNCSLHLIKNTKNRGFAGGNNAGITYALKNNANYIFVLNNDTELHEECILELVNHAQKYKETLLFTPKIYFAKGYEFHKNRYKQRELGNVIWSAGGDIDWDNMYGTNHGVDEVDQKQFDSVYETDFATGAAFFARAELFNTVGLFNESYYLYLEDVELSLRVIKAHSKILFIPSAKLWHKVSQSSAIGGMLNDYFIARNRLLLGMKYASLRTKFALLRESLRIIVSGRKWQKRGVIDFYVRKFGKGSWK